MFADKKALHTTRISSQVCRRWRDLMLDRPFLWARLIDMEEIRHASTPQRWWNVLIQRSGAALLWIRAESESFRRSHPEATDNSIKLEQLFFGFINSNWHRIQRLVIDGNYPAPGLTHAMVSFPAPQLKEFEMPLPKETGDSRSGDLDNEGTITTPIFSGHAPLLRRFRCVGYIVDRQAPWLGNLHSIELNRLYSISDALAVLSAAHSLTEIIIDKLVDGKPSEPLFNVSLPRLKSFRCEASPQPCARLLGQLEFPLGCSMNIHISKYNDPNSIAEENPYLLQVVNIFSLYTKRHLQSSHK
ncbi:hypothetical protein HYPSUDRAFT_1025047 [Hypholoma sublateritium FD-334 SS-4]|uniref:Uncharacterized protein n=1 Tax=Hypholoma sublateritium (strain FD-334 SS-4) TaxID=945553 RepID=A0A0D2NE83_HYPSF|nr:hypothetical protein HYPSUDRAFT_1025047 [Hypholoma sublateritium FD-334 SS-4]